MQIIYTISKHWLTWIQKLNISNDWLAKTNPSILLHRVSHKHTHMLFSAMIKCIYNTTFQQISTINSPNNHHLSFVKYHKQSFVHPVSKQQMGNMFMHKLRAPVIVLFSTHNHEVFPAEVAFPWVVFLSWARVLWSRTSSAPLVKVEAVAKLCIR